MSTPQKIGRFTGTQENIFFGLALCIIFAGFISIPYGLGAPLIPFGWYCHNLLVYEPDYLLALIYEKFGRYEKALQAISRQIDISEIRVIGAIHLPKHYLERASIYEHLGRFEEAEQDRILADEADLSVKIDRSQGKLAEVIRICLRRPTELQELYLARAAVNEKLGRTELAVQDYRMASQVPKIRSR
jgi:tetratricopeptide (TPR) repeat protein